jgi:hypothetical protein
VSTRNEELTGHRKGDVRIGFGALPPLPEGYSVVWLGGTEMYCAEGPGEWESVATCDRFQARGWCFEDARRREVES